MNSLEVALAARERLTDPANWTVGATWTREGARCEVDQADRGCAVGTPYIVAYPDGAPRTSLNIIRVQVVLGIVAKAMGYDTITDLNDKGGHAKVLEMYDRAIELLRQEEGPQAGLEQPSYPMEVPGPNEERRHVPAWPESPSEPAPDVAPVDPVREPSREPVPA
jgi:hypothetical protein